MAEHECVVGIIHVCDDSELTTVAGLREHIADRIRRNRDLLELGVVAAWMFRKEWSLKDYADKRKSTNLTQFDFCPECGKRIDWAAIRKEADGK